MVGLVTAGVEKVRVLANGNVGIGTTNPLAKLHVNGSFYAPGCVVQRLLTKINTLTSISSSTYQTTVVSGTITPKFSTSLIMIEASVQVYMQSTTGSVGFHLQIRRDGVVDTTTVGGEADSQAFIFTTLTGPSLHIKIPMTTSYIAGSSASTTFNVWARQYQSNTGVSAQIGSISGAFGRSEVIITEIAQ
jgi:hypothetical protein